MVFTGSTGARSGDIIRVWFANSNSDVGLQTANDDATLSICQSTDRFTTRFASERTRARVRISSENSRILQFVAEALRYRRFFVPEETVIKLHIF